MIDMPGTEDLKVFDKYQIMEKKQLPTYYSIIPATVRYDKRLKPIERIIYSEISCLCNLKGYCWATNKDIGENYDISPTTISRYISKLSDLSYIRVIVEQDKGNFRRIYLNDQNQVLPIDRTVNTLLIEQSIPIDRTVNHNTIIEYTKDTKEVKNIKKESLSLFDDGLKPELVNGLAKEEYLEGIKEDDLKRLRKLTKGKKDLEALIILVVKHFRDVTGKNKVSIYGRGVVKAIGFWKNDGYGLEDFKKVIDYKTRQFRKNGFVDNINLDTYLAQRTFEASLGKENEMLSIEVVKWEESENEEYKNFCRFLSKEEKKIDVRFIPNELEFRVFMEQSEGKRERVRSKLNWLIKGGRLAVRTDKSLLDLTMELCTLN